ncbi:MAG: hypothetical protein ACM3QZ_13425 [Solirubrobacterales bacterium]
MAKRDTLLRVEDIQVDSREYQLVAETIEQYKLLDDVNNVVFLFSGGKDATFGLLAMDNYLRTHRPDISLNAVMVTYPTHVYYEKDGKPRASFEKLKNFWREAGVAVDIYDSPEPDLEEAATQGCKICKHARKTIVDAYLKRWIGKPGKTAIVTGYTLYDILAYLDEFGLYTNFTYDINSVDEHLTKRVKNCLHKMSVREDLPNGLRLIRPLVRLKENDILQYITSRDIPYMNHPCIAAEGKHKRAYFGGLNLLAHADRSSYSGIMDFLDRHHVQLPETFDDVEDQGFFTDC